jgi:hypothetical protein
MCKAHIFIRALVFSFFAANKKLIPFTEAAKVLNLGIAKNGFTKAERKGR